MNKKQTPLGIIAIFASLAEISATVVLIQLPDSLQQIFIWFVIGFPLILIALFFYVLWKKPQNYYSPIEYKNEENFMRLMKVTETVKQIAEEINTDETISEDTRNELLQHLEGAIDNGTENNLLSTMINGVEIQASTVKSFYKKVFECLTSNHINFEQLVPFKTGNKRYLINSENKHINGNKFYSPLVYKKYYIECHKSKIGAKSDIEKFLKELGLSN